MAAKPIFVVGVPLGTSIATSSNIVEQIKEKLEDYYIIVYPTNTSEFNFQCFYEKDFNDVKYEELKAIIQQNQQNQDGN